MARVSLMRKEQASPEVQEVFERLEARGARVVNIYRTLAHSRAAMRHFMRLGNSLLERCHLDHRLRELAILRVARLTGSQYEWTQHVTLARECGVTPEQMEAMVTIAHTTPDSTIVVFGEVAKEDWAQGGKLAA